MKIKKIAKIFNVRIILLITCVVVFVFFNSSQESYLGIENVPVSTLITTDLGNTNTTDPPTTTSSGPTPPTDIPSSPPTGGITQGDKPTLDSQFLPIILSAAILIMIGFLFLRRRRREDQHSSSTRRTREVASLSAKRDRFQTQIKSLVDLLYEYLEEGKYTEGVIFGFHELDKNMKRILGVEREGYLTPKEFSSNLELPEMVQSLDEMVQTFYIARYRISPMEYKDLEDFINHLVNLKEISRMKSDIQIVQREIIGEEK